MQVAQISRGGLMRGPACSKPALDQGICVQVAQRGERQAPQQGKTWLASLGGSGIS